MKSKKKVHCKRRCSIDNGLSIKHNTFTFGALISTFMHRYCAHFSYVVDGETGG